jgi:hypothetical protein
LVEDSMVEVGLAEMYHLIKMILDRHVSFLPKVPVETVPTVIFHIPPTPAVNIPTTTTIATLHLEVMAIIIRSEDHVDNVHLNH